MRFRLPITMSVMTILLTLVMFNILQSIINIAEGSVAWEHEEAVLTESDEFINEAPVFRVVIDPGHGGKDPGAKGASGKLEKDFTLELSRKITSRLKNNPDFEVLMTRENDQFLSSEERIRPNMANEVQADIFISIHGNTFSNRAVSGTETFYYHENSRELADILHRHLVQATGFPDRGVKREEYFVLTDTYMPAVLLEIGYLTNPDDEKMMLSPAFQEKVADALYAGIVEYASLHQ